MLNSHPSFSHGNAGACAVGIIFMAALAALTLGMLAVAVGVAAKEPDERVGVT